MKLTSSLRRILATACSATVLLSPCFSTALATSSSSTDITASQSGLDDTIEVLAYAYYTYGLCVEPADNEAITLTSIDKDVSVTNYYGYTYGVEICDGATVESIDEGVTISATASGSSYHSFAYALDIYEGTLESLSGTVTATVTGDHASYYNESVAVSVFLGALGSITDTAVISATSSSTDSVVGVELYYATSTTELIAGTISATGTTSSTSGYAVTGIAVWNSNVDEISATVTAISNNQTAVGLYLGWDTYMTSTVTPSVESISGTISATSEDNIAKGIFVEGDGILGTISGTITATTKDADSDAYGIQITNYSDITDYTLTFASGASVSAINEGEAYVEESGYNTYYGAATAVAIIYDNTAIDDGSEVLTFALDGSSSGDEVVTIVGDIVVGTSTVVANASATDAGSIVFESGSYDITLQSIVASSITFEAGVSVSLTAEETFNFDDWSGTNALFADDTELIFIIDDLNEASGIFALSGEVDMSSISEFSIVLTGQAAEDWANGETISLNDIITADGDDTNYIACMDEATSLNISTVDENGETTSTSNALLLSAISADGAVTITSMSIPEPSTATLSFLALLGLCARRRRNN